MDAFTSACAMLATAIVLASSIFLMRKSQTHSINKKQAPKARGGWPIIGHLPLLSSSDMLPHRMLGALADVYGPIFRIKLGVKEALVVSSREMAKECLETNDRAVLNRGKSVGMEVLGYNYAMFGFTPYGSYWRHMRKIVTIQLFSKKSLNVLSNVFESEASKSVRRMYEQWIASERKTSVVVDLTKVLSQLTLNLSIRVVFGKQIEEEDGEEGLRIHEVVRRFFKLLGTFTIGDAVPFMRWIDLGGQEKAMKKCSKELDNIVQGWLDEHKQRRCDSLGSNDNAVDKDFMSAMLDVDDEIKEIGYDADTVNKATCLEMLLGGSDTTEVTLIWAFSLLMNNPEVMKKAKDELNLHVGKDRQVGISDIPKLTYLEAIVKETFRLYPAAPLMAPREFIKDCTIGNYNIKRGTKLIVNVSKISRDPLIWDNPLEFRPERFLDTHKDVDVKGRNFELIPFGAGRRMCPGMSFGLQAVHLFLATLLDAFEFATQHNAPVDLSESFGITNMKAKPLQVHIDPSLNSEAYAP